MKKRKKKITHKNNFDPLGSYTGVPIDSNVPIQDADDL